MLEDGKETNYAQSGRGRFSKSFLNPTYWWVRVQAPQ